LFAPTTVPGLALQRTQPKVTIRPRFSGTFPEIELASRADIVPDFLKIILIGIYIEYEIYTD
jgi:hypothetical protein